MKVGSALKLSLCLTLAVMSAHAQTPQAPTPTPTPAECHTLTPAQARDALKFLGRVDLKGVEAPVFMALGEAVQSLALLESVRDHFVS